MPSRVRLKIKDETDGRRLAEFRRGQVDLRESLNLITVLLEKHADNPMLTVQLINTQTKLSAEIRTGDIANNKFVHIDEVQRYAVAIGGMLTQTLDDFAVENRNAIIDAMYQKIGEFQLVNSDKQKNAVKRLK